MASSPPWHVAHVIGALRIGGAERQLVNYLLAADRREFRHTALCLTAGGPLAETVAASGIPVIVFPVRGRTVVRDLWRLARWLRTNRVRVVHAHMFYGALWGRAAAVLGGVPVRVVTEHGRELWKNRLQVLTDRLLSRVTCRHIAVSEDGRRLRIARERIPAAKIVLIPNGVQVPPLEDRALARRAVRDALGLPFDAPLIGTVGRVVAAKAYPTLLAALGRVRAGSPAVRWLLVGDGPELPGLLAQAEREGLRDAVVSVGFRTDIPDLLRAMDLFVMCSEREGLPVALLEAMAAACPVVVTAVGGMPDAVQTDVNGLVVPPSDPVALAAALARLLDDPEEAARLGAAARSTVQQRYGIESVARRVEAVYRDCLTARGGARS